MCVIKVFFHTLLMIIGVISIFALPVGEVEARSAAGALKKMDSDADGRLSRSEWRKRKLFDGVDLDRDGYLSRRELKVFFGEAEIDGQPDAVTMAAIRRAKFDDVAHLKARGLFETGLKPVWEEGVSCPAPDHWFAMDYTSFRAKESYHGGIDIPAPFGTPVLAVMEGEVVARYEGMQNPRGIELVLRHTPEQSGLPYYIYTRYTHFQRMPELNVGDKVAMGDELGVTGNTGVRGCEIKGLPCRGQRRPLLHFDVLYTHSERYFDTGAVLVPFEAYWMDPTALFRRSMPVNSWAMRDLSNQEKEVPIAYQLESGGMIPAGTGVIWPYRCHR